MSILSDQQCKPGGFEIWGVQGLELRGFGLEGSAEESSGRGHYFQRGLGSQVVIRATWGHPTCSDHEILVTTYFKHPVILQLEPKPL